MQTNRSFTRCPTLHTGRCCSAGRRAFRVRAAVTRPEAAHCPGAYLHSRSLFRNREEVLACLRAGFQARLEGQRQEQQGAKEALGKQ
jgi:hypothetical protein